jgi:hypothetical protein
MRAILVLTLSIGPLLCQAVGQQLESPNHSESAITKVGHGTLVVAIATPRFIVVATDSRRTYRPGVFDDHSKKLFRVGKRRVLAIAGLADADLNEVPGLTEQTAPLLDEEISEFYKYGANLDDMVWNDPSQLSSHKDNIPYLWWKAVKGPIQTITNIAATFPMEDLSHYRLYGLLAGFKSNGEAKIEHFSVEPIRGVSGSGRPLIGPSEFREQQVTKDHLIFKTMGIAQYANSVLNGELDEDARRAAAKYPAIQKFLRRRAAGSTDRATEQEIVGLCKELIRLTADRNPLVGHDPIQIAVIRPHKNVVFDQVVDQPLFPSQGHFLSAQGSWNPGVVFTPDYPFDQLKSGAVYTFCEISKNRIPIPLGNNYFYGNEFDETTFVYSGGNISFGNNNKCQHCKLILSAGVDDSSIAQVRDYFETIEHQEAADSSHGESKK